MKYVVLAGRVLFALIFIMSGFGHFGQGTINYAGSNGVPMAGLLVPVSGIMAIAGGIMILVGFKAKAGGWLIAAFLVPVTLMMHKFWAVTDPQMVQLQQAMFFKNLAMLGGALMFAYFGAGPLSIDAAMRKGSSTEEEAHQKIAA